MKNNLFNKIRLYLFYRSTIKKYFLTLNTNFNLRKDLSNRLYTVVNIPIENFDESTDNSMYINTISDKFIRDFLIKIGKSLDLLGLKELYKVYSISKVDKYSYLIIIGFSLFETDKVYKNIINFGLISVGLFLLYKLFHFFI